MNKQHAKMALEAMENAIICGNNVILPGNHIATIKSALQSVIEAGEKEVRSMVFFVEALGFVHTMDNGDHIVTGHGFSKRHVSMTCIINRIADHLSSLTQSLSGQTAQPDVMGADIKLQVLRDMAKEGYDVTTVHSIAIDRFYAALRSPGMVMVPENELPAALWYPLPEGRVIGENQRIESVVSMEDAYRCAAALKKAMIAARPKGE